MTRYAIVPSRGCYGSGETVHAVRVCRDRHHAIEIAERMTREYRAGMARYGGSSGGYRVVATSAASARSASWIGHDLDRTPSVTITRPGDDVDSRPYLTDGCYRDTVTRDAEVIL